MRQTGLEEFKEYDSLVVFLHVAPAYIANFFDIPLMGQNAKFFQRHLQPAYRRVYNSRRL